MKNPQIVHIKHMVCSRCIRAVEDSLHQSELPVVRVLLGEVHFSRMLEPHERQELARRLDPLGFALIDDRKSRLINQLKTLIIDLVHHQQEGLKTNLSTYLSEHLSYDYSTLSTLFSSVEGTTVEQFYIAHKIERAKELLVYDELNLSEIAFMLHYSSVAHLSRQFKKVTGLSPSHFKQLKSAKRKALDKL